LKANPVWLYELLVAPAAFGLAALHARRALGSSRASLELLSLVLYGFGLEWTAMRVFSSHVYGDAWALAPFGVPVAVALVWASVIVSALALAARLGYASPVARGAAAALVGIALDLLMEPVAVQAGFWHWTPPGPWLDVPVGNFVGWAVVVGGWAVGAESWRGSQSGLRHALARAALGGSVVLALLGVGFAWRGLAAERLFEGRASWIVWVVLLALAAGLRLKRPAASERWSLAARLAAAPGPLPEAVIVLVLAAFAWEALRLGGVFVVVAAGSALALMFPLLPTPKRGRDSLPAERAALT
jgi:uncharacterized membrane protein